MVINILALGLFLTSIVSLLGTLNTIKLMNKLDTLQNEFDELKLALLEEAIEDNLLD